MNELRELHRVLLSNIGMSQEAVDLSTPYWMLREYKKGEYYNEYKNICKHLGFVLDGVFRIYRANQESGEEKNMMFFTNHQFIASYKSFLTQTECMYFTESMVKSTILYIHIDHLNQLYRQSHEWERFGRILAESALNAVMTSTEGFLFHTPEERYLQLIEKHPDIFNAIPLYHIASYLGIQGASLSRIRKRMQTK
ncbi:MAG TPA: Crp/Fnr family transcriptional regulator [Puia sp.]|nr:Crp/Fnr family transcriptional regulator [Puia sp.]